MGQSPYNQKQLDPENQHMEDLDPIKLKAELDNFKKEKEKIRKLMGQIGGKEQAERDKWINILFIAAIALLGINDLLHHIWHARVPIDTEFSLVIAILLVSIKIIWMMHKSTKVEHFQFWILNSIEFRLNDVAKQLRNLENTVIDYHTDPERDDADHEAVTETEESDPGKPGPS
jgi:phage/plasmid-associated DNA primase